MHIKSKRERAIRIQYCSLNAFSRALNVNPITYSYLRVDTLDYTPEPQTAEIACR